MHTFHFRGFRVRYVARGERGPPMVLLHNGGTDHTIWREQIARFASSHQVFALDLLGCGKSDRPDIPYDVTLYADLLDQFLRDQDLENPVLVGNCVGAGAALELAIRNPDLPAALVLFNVYGGSTTMKSLKLVEWGLVPAALAARAISWPWLNPASVLWGEPPAAEDPLFRHYVDEIERHPQAILSRKNLIRGASSFNKFGRPFASPENFPRTCLIWGAANQVLSVDAGRRLRAWLQPDEYHEISGAGHLAMHEAGTEVNEKLARFLT